MEHNFGFSPGKQKKKKKKKKCFQVFPGAVLGWAVPNFFVCMFFVLFLLLWPTLCQPCPLLFIVSVNVCIVNIVSVCHALVVVIK